MRTALRSIVLLVAICSAAGSSAATYVLGQAPFVAADGTVLALHPVLDATSTFPVGTELVAASPAGVLLWRRNLGSFLRDLTVAGNLVIATAGPELAAGKPTTLGSTMLALQLASGVEAWKLSLPGSAAGVTLAGDRLYITVVGTGTMVPVGGMMHGSGNLRGVPATPTGMAITPRNLQGPYSLAAVEVTGKLLWVVLLDKGQG